MVILAQYQVSLSAMKIKVLYNILAWLLALNRGVNLMIIIDDKITLDYD